MNIKENQKTYLFLLAVINVFAIIAGIYIGMSEILINSRYGFITIIFTVACIADYLLIKYRDGQIKEFYDKQLEKANKDADKFKNRMLEIAEERDNLYAKLEKLDTSAIEDELAVLKQKCDTIERYRNKFPHKIAEGYVLYNVIRTNLQVGKASTWQIVGDFNGELWEMSIVRPHTQTYKEMLTLLAATTEPAKITELNQSDTLLWE